VTNRMPGGSRSGEPKGRSEAEAGRRTDGGQGVEPPVCLRRVPVFRADALAISSRADAREVGQSELPAGQQSHSREEPRQFYLERCQTCDCTGLDFLMPVELGL